MTFVQNALGHGIGLGVLPTFLSDADVRQGRLLQVLPGLALMSGTIWFLTPPTHRKTARALDTLRDCITEVLTATKLAPRFITYPDNRDFFYLVRRKSNP
jgi:DNA-binding transcriptional LysR family regulator